MIKQKYYTFLPLLDLNYFTITNEDFFLRYWEYSKNIVMVNILDLSKKIDFRVMGIHPLCLSNQSKERLLKYSGCPKLVMGQYYDPKKLLFMEDFLSYCHHQIKFDEIRKASDINLTLMQD